MLRTQDSRFTEAAARSRRDPDSVENFGERIGLR